MPSTDILLFSLIVCAVRSTVCDRCCEISYRELPRYDLIKINSRSNQPIISRQSVSSLSECEKFAASKKALAFNFVSARNRAGGRENACQALQCPEDHNMTTLVPAANYRYYSMYPVFVPPANATTECIPRTGMFLFSLERLNYTQARNFCRDHNASLAHVISEERTEGLGKIVSRDLPSFVGLSNNDKERIWKNEFGEVRESFDDFYDKSCSYEPLSCFDYRAWGAGEPSHSKGCVGLVNPSSSSVASDNLPFWRTLPCYTSLPFICEVSPLSRRSSSSSRRRHRNRHSA